MNAIEFTFRLPKTVKHIFGVSPKDYNPYMTEDFIFKGVPRFPDWLAEELEYWNKFRPRTVDSSGYREVDPYGTSNIGDDGNFVIDNEELRRCVIRRYTDGGLPVPEELRGALPEDKSNVTHKFGRFLPEDYDPDESDSDRPYRFIEACSPLYLGNLARFLPDLEKDEKQIAFLIKMNPGSNESLYIENEGKTCVANDVGDTTFVNSCFVPSLADTTVSAPAMMTPDTELYHDEETNSGDAVFLLLSAEAIRNSPTNGEHVVLNVFNGAKDADEYGYYY